MINEVPSATPVITPVEESIVALAVVPLDQTPPAVVLANVVVKPTHTSAVPVKAFTVGKACIVMVFVAVFTHPVTPSVTV